MLQRADEHTWSKSAVTTAGRKQSHRCRRRCRCCCCRRSEENVGVPASPHQHHIAAMTSAAAAYAFSSISFPSRLPVSINRHSK